MNSTETRQDQSHPIASRKHRQGVGRKIGPADKFMLYLFMAFLAVFGAFLLGDLLTNFVP